MIDVPAVAPNGWWHRYAVVAVLVAGMGFSAYLHVGAGLTLPVPWPDESVYIWPAVSIAQNATMMSPWTNPERHVLWQAPGLPVLLAGYMKLFPGDLISIRWFSWVLMQGAWLLLLVWIGGFRIRLRDALVSLPFVLAAPVVIAGNMIRQEPATLVIALCGGLLAAGRRPMAAMAMFCLSGLMHPNGVYFVGVGVIWCLIEGRRHPIIRSRCDWGIIVPAAAAGILWLSYIAQHWNQFLIDITWSMNYFHGSDVTKTDRLLSPPVLAGSFAWLGFLWLSRGHLRSRSVLFAAGITMWLITPLRPEMWYEVYGSFSLIIVAAGLAGLAPACRGRTDTCVVAVTAILLVFSAYRGDFIEGPRGYPHDMYWKFMKGWEEVEYMTEEDRELVNEAIIRTVGEESARVFLYPEGDGALLYLGWPEKITPFQPVFSEIEPDFVLIHQSRYLHAWWYPKYRELTAQYALETQEPIHQRDETEAWYLVRVKQTDHE